MIVIRYLDMRRAATHEYDIRYVYKTGIDFIILLNFKFGGGAGYLFPPYFFTYFNIGPTTKTTKSFTCV